MFVHVDEAAPYLEEMLHKRYDSDSFENIDDISMIVLETDQGARAYADYYLLQPHVVQGGTVDGEEVIMTYCVLANLPTPFINDINGSEVNFKVLAQTNNNLLIWDRASGEIIQQITQTCEFSQNRLDPVPVMEMTWKGFKRAFPQGTVFYNQWDSPVEIALDAVMPLEDNFTSDQWMFNTVNFDDKRFKTKEMIIGISDPDSDAHLAISRPELIKQKEHCVCLSASSEASDECMTS